MTMAADIIALGEPLIEFVATGQSDGKSPLWRQSFGGDTSNAIIAAARQGARTGYLTAVGNDMFGASLLELWRREGVATTGVVTRQDDPTGAYFVQPHASGRSFTYARRGSAASLYAPSDLPHHIISQARILHVSALSQAISPTMRDAVSEAAKIATGCGTAISYDTNLRLNLWDLATAREAILDFLPYATYIFPSDDEAEILTGLTDPDKIIDYFLGFSPELVILKRGEKGAIVATPDNRFSVAACPVTAVDSTGAGDSYAGAFLAWYLKTGDAALAGRAAAIVAAGTVSGLGAIDPIPPLKSVLNSLETVAIGLEAEFRPGQ